MHGTSSSNHSQEKRALISNFWDYARESKAKIPVMTLVSLWLEYKRFTKLNWLFKPFYSGPTDEALLLSMAKRYTLQNDSVYGEEPRGELSIHEIFGTENTAAIISALCELGIFLGVVSDLFSRDSSKSLAERQAVSDIISNKKVDESLEYSTPTNNDVKIQRLEAGKFFALRKVFCNSISVSFCEDKRVEAHNKVLNSTWRTLSENLKAYEEARVLYFPEASFPKDELEGIRITSFSELLICVDLYYLQSDLPPLFSFLKDNFGNDHLVRFLDVAWNNHGVDRTFLVELCYLFLQEDNSNSLFLLQAFLLEKIRIGECDFLLADKRIDQSIIFGPTIAARLLYLEASL
jgi:hypothetical protein